MSKELDLDREAWRLILDCAEGGVEDALNEDPDSEFSDEEFDRIQNRAMAIIVEMRGRNEQ